MPAIRVLAGLAMILFAVPVYAIGFMFVFGDRSNQPFAQDFAVHGMQGIYAPILLCGVHLLTSSHQRSRPFRIIMAALLALSVAFCLGGLLPWLLADPPHQQAGQIILSALISAGVFGWPIIAACFRGN